MSAVDHMVRSERRVILALTVAVVAIVAGAIVLQANGFAILIAVFAVPIGVWLIAQPAVALGAVFFCFFTNAQQVLSLWHGFDYLTELLLLLLFGLLVRDIWLGRVSQSNAGFFSALVALNIAFALLQIVFSAEPSMTASSTVEIFKYGVIALVLIILLRDTARLQGAGAGIVLALLFMASITIVQFQFGLYHLNFGGFGAVTYHNIVGEIDYWRVDGPLTDPNFYAQVLLICLPFAYGGLSRAGSSTWRMICLAALVTGLFAIVLTYSRGVLVGLVILLIVYNRRRWPFIIGCIAVLSVIPAVANVPYFERIGAAISDVIALLQGDGYLQDEAINGRLSEMLAAMYLFFEHPFIGIGVGQYEIYYQDAARHYGLMARGADREAHSLILELLAERGLVGALLYSLMIAGAVICASRAGRSAASPMALALLYALLAYYLTSLFLHAAFPMYLWLILALCFAVAPKLQFDRGARSGLLQIGDYDDEMDGVLQ